MKGVLLLLFISISSFAFAQGTGQSRQTLILQLKPMVSMNVDRSKTGASVQFSSNTNLMLNVNAENIPAALGLSVEAPTEKPNTVHSTSANLLPPKGGRNSLAINNVNEKAKASNVIYTLTNK